MEDYKGKAIWMATREYEGIAGVGGVKDVCRYLAEALAKKGIEVQVFLPRYGFIDPGQMGFSPIGTRLSVDMDYASQERREEVSFLHREINGVNLILVESQRFSEKLGIYTYTEEEEKMDPWKRKGDGHFDYFATNVLLQKGVLAFGAYHRVTPWCIHCHDGHTALIPGLMREIEGYRHLYLNTKSVVTIHNAGIGYHQDVADLPFAKAITGLPWSVINGSLLNGAFDPFLCAANYATLNTVSENYARELQETDLDTLTGWLGHTLKERGVVLHGITNGIDPDAYDPRHPERLGLPMGFDPLGGDLEGKLASRRLLKRRIDSRSLEGLTCLGEITDDTTRPLLTSIGRLTSQKGVDVLIGALEGLATSNRAFDCLIMGSGEPEFEDRLKALIDIEGLKGHLALLLGYSERIGNLVYAAGDFFIIPSLYEPCGLTDFIAQLFGNIPIVRATGGLVKVRDGETGLSYREHHPNALANTILRALDLYENSPHTLQAMRERAIHLIYERYTWDKVSEKYLALYESA